MAKQTPAQQAKPLLDLYKLLYKEKYGKAPIVNAYKGKWGFVDMLGDFDFEQCKEIVEFYFKTETPGHSLVGLFTSYESLFSRKLELEADRQRKRELLAATKAKVEELKCQQKKS